MKIVAKNPFDHSPWKSPPRILIVDFSLAIFPLDDLALVGDYNEQIIYTYVYVYIYIYSESTRFSKFLQRGSLCECFSRKTLNVCADVLVAIYIYILRRFIFTSSPIAFPFSSGSFKPTKPSVLYPTEFNFFFFSLIYT